MVRLFVAVITCLCATAALAAEPAGETGAAEVASASAVDGAAAVHAAEPADTPDPAGEGPDVATDPKPAEPASAAPTGPAPPSTATPAMAAPAEVPGPAGGSTGPAAKTSVEPAGPSSPLALTFALGGDLMQVDTDSQWGMTLRLGVQWSDARWRLHGAAGYAYNEIDARAAAFDAYLGGAYRALRWLDVGLYASGSVGSTGLFDPWYERTWAIGAELAECVDLSERAQLCFAQRVAPLGALTRRAVIVDGDVYRLPLETDRLIRAEATIGFRQEL